MKFEIKHRYSGEILFSIETTSWKLAVEAAIKGSADLRYADLRYADLRYADLSYADLRYADLRYADLRYADLRYADLSYADLSYADLRYATTTGDPRLLSTPLMMLLDQDGPITAYKLVTQQGIGPFNGGITYEIGKSYEQLDADTSVTQDCGVGLHVGTLDWCLRKWQPGYRILTVWFTKDEIACIPFGTDGKFRVFRLTVTGEKDLSKPEFDFLRPKKEVQP